MMFFVVVVVFKKKKKKVLEKFLGEHPEAPNLSGKLSQLNDAKERMARVNATLGKIQLRLERLYAEHHQPREQANP